VTSRRWPLLAGIALGCTGLLTAKGYALYMFRPDNQRSVTGTGACAGPWPPVKVPAGGAANSPPWSAASPPSSRPSPSST
jgi:predicted lipoprotein with Yx(FWY)xxD motif